MSNRPAFFKFYMPEFSGEDMKIPPMFIRSIQGTLPENIALLDRYNNLWQVKLDKVGDNWYFTDGWKKFVQDNKIKCPDILVFDYFSEGLFGFKIYGTWACEEKRFGDHKYKNTTVEQDKIIELDDDDDDDVDDSDSDDYVLTTQERQQPNNCPRRGQEANSGSSSNARGSKRNWDWYGEEIFKTGLVRQPINPYFVTRIRRNRAFELYIPMDVVKGFDLQLPKTIFLVDPTGRKFHAQRKIWKDRRVVYTGGWKTLCAANLVGNDDDCICEFVHPQGEDLFLSVSFFRANRQQS